MLPISKEYSNLKPIVDSFSEFKSVEENIDESNQLLNDSDSEIRALAQEELEILKNGHLKPAPLVSLGSWSLHGHSTWCTAEVLLYSSFRNKRYGSK